MAIKFACPTCNADYAVNDRLGGSLFECWHCPQRILVPANTGTDQPAADVPIPFAQDVHDEPSSLPPVYLPPVRRSRSRLIGPLVASAFVLAGLAFAIILIVAVAARETSQPAVAGKASVKARTERPTADVSYQRGPAIDPGAMFCVSLAIFLPAAFMGPIYLVAHTRRIPSSEAAGQVLGAIGTVIGAVLVLALGLLFILAATGGRGGRGVDSSPAGMCLRRCMLCGIAIYGDVFATCPKCGRLLTPVF
jgi:hypothetical protein